MLPEYDRFEIASMTQVLYHFRWGGLVMRIELAQPMGIGGKSAAAGWVSVKDPTSPLYVGPMIRAKVNGLPIPLVDFNTYKHKDPKRTTLYKIAQRIADFVATRKRELVIDLFERVHDIGRQSPTWEWTSIEQS